MSDKVNEAEFWLPSEFLTEEDIVMDCYGVSGSPRSRFTPEFGNHYGSFNSSTGLSSPVESVVCSTDTESDVDESLASELTRMLTLLGASKLTPCQHRENKGLVMSGSPQSTLNWSGGRFMPTNGSPNGAFHVSSAATGKEDAWDLIFQAAGQATLLKNSGGCGARNQGFLGPQSSLTTPPLPAPKSSAPSALHLSQLVNSQKLLEQGACGIWSKQMINGRSYDQRKYPNVGDSGPFAGGFGLYSSACPNLKVFQKIQQLREESGTRGGLHLGDGYGFGPGYGCGSGAGVGVGGVKSERVGTGVFLPRRYGSNGSSNGSSTLDYRKKQGGSSALLPSKGIPASKKYLTNPSNIAEFPSLPRFSSGSIGDNGAILARKAALLTLQRTFSDGAATAINHDICLPQEWTY